MKKRDALFLAILIIIPAVLISGPDYLKESGIKTGMTAAPRKIGLVKINEVIFNADNIVETIEDFQDNNEIAGIILRVDSPGGAVAPSQEIFEAVKKFAASGKPVVVSMGSVAASGGYYVSAPATKIFASHGTITGSIGVIMQFPQYHELLDKVGIGMTTIKAGKLKDVGNPNRDPTPEELRYLQSFIDNSHEQFIQDIASSRSIPVDELRQIADGRIFTGTQAKEVALIDTIGGYSEALAYLKNITHIKSKARPETKIRNADLFRELMTESIFKLFPMARTKTVPPGCYYLFNAF